MILKELLGYFLVLIHHQLMLHPEVDKVLVQNHRLILVLFAVAGKARHQDGWLHLLRPPN